MSEYEPTTSELASMLGVKPYTLRKWKARGDLPNAPNGRAGQGRGNECRWSSTAVAEAMKLAQENRSTGYRRLTERNDHGSK